MSEIGPRDQLLGSFANADRFCAWLGVCPCNRISGGRVLGSATRKTSNRLAEALRLAAFGLERAKCRLGESCRRKALQGCDWQYLSRRSLGEDGWRRRMICG
jgi:transposase